MVPFPVGRAARPRPPCPAAAPGSARAATASCRAGSKVVPDVIAAREAEAGQHVQGLLPDGPDAVDDGGRIGRRRAASARSRLSTTGSHSPGHRGPGLRRPGGPGRRSACAGCPDRPAPAAAGPPARRSGPAARRSRSVAGARRRCRRGIRAWPGGAPRHPALAAGAPDRAAAGRTAETRAVGRWPRAMAASLMGGELGVDDVVVVATRAEAPDSGSRGRSLRRGGQDSGRPAAARRSGCASGPAAPGP